MRSTLASLRALQVQRPASLRAYGQRLERFGDQVWKESAAALRTSDPEAAERVIANHRAATARVVICAVAILLTIALFISGTNLTAALSALLTGLLIRWAWQTWPWTTRLELFLLQTKPPFHGTACSDPAKVLAAQLAELTDGFSGRDLQQMISKAVLSAVKRTTRTGNEFRLETTDFELIPRRCRQ